MSDDVMLRDLRRAYVAMRRAHMTEELRKLSLVSDEMLRILSTFFDADDMVRWLCMAHPLLDWERPLDYIVEHDDGTVEVVRHAAAASTRRHD